MSRDKLLVLTYGLLIALLVVGCVSSWRSEPRPERSAQEASPTAYPDQQLVGQEEVLSDQEDEFGRPLPGPTTKAGEFLVAIGYVGTIVAGILLPLFVL